MHSKFKLYSVFNGIIHIILLLNVLMYFNNGWVKMQSTEKAEKNGERIWILYLLFLQRKRRQVVREKMFLFCVFPWMLWRGNPKLRRWFSPPLRVLFTYPQLCCFAHPPQSGKYDSQNGSEGMSWTFNYSWTFFVAFLKTLIDTRLSEKRFNLTHLEDYAQLASLMDRQGALVQLKLFKISRETRVVNNLRCRRKLFSLRDT